ncbi:hypothetical protein [Geminicoccus flavidas]|uniref:hypothetical protein n=1 Tax=Geminicoccus flavidas TaxID=2506407 RepID=UPI00135CB718|nr:hypothetical protein [Geminicoccus flavidas]
MRAPMRRSSFPLTQEKAGYARYCVFNLGLSQTETAIIVKLNQGTVCHVVHGRRFPDVPATRPPWM